MKKLLFVYFLLVTIYLSLNNIDYLVYHTIFFLILSFSVIQLTKKYDKLVFFNPLIIFNSTYYIIFSITDIFNDLYNPNLTFLIILGFFSINFGYFLITNFNKKVFLTKNKPIYQGIIYAQFTQISLFIGVLSSICYFYKFGAPLFSENITKNRTLSLTVDISPIFQIIKYNANVVLMLFIMSESYNRIYKIKKKPKYLTMILALVYFVMLIIETNRTSFYYIIFPCFFFYFFLNIEKFKLKNFKYIAYFIVIASSVSSLRYGKIENIGLSIYKEFLALKYNLSHVFDYWSVNDDLRYGEMHMRGMKVLLPGRQEDTSLYLKHFLELKFAGGGMTPTLIGQIYIDFGVVGIFIEMFLLGILLALVFNYFLKSKDMYVIILYAYLLAYIPYIMRNGLFYSYVNVFVVIMIFLHTRRYTIKNTEFNEDPTNK